MAVTVKSRAKAYAEAIALRKLRHEGGEPTAALLRQHTRVTPSLLALARINLQREVRKKLNAKPAFKDCIGLAGMLCTEVKR